MSQQQPHHEQLPHDPERYVALRAGRETSEHARAVLAQYGGGGLFGAVLLLASVIELPTPVMITALVCSALVMVAPTVSYIASRSQIKQCILESQDRPLSPNTWSADSPANGWLHPDPTLTVGGTNDVHGGDKSK